MSLYREDATGFLQEWATNPGAGYTALSAQPTDTLANRVNWWRAADLGGLSSAWHPSLQGGMEVPKPPGTAGSGVNIMAYRYSSWEEPDGLPSLTLTNATAARNSGGYNGAYKLSLTATAGNGTAYLTPLSNVYNIKLTQNLRWIVSLYVSPATSGAKDFNLLVKTSGAGTVYSLPMTTGATAGQWTRVYAALDLRADTSVSAMLGLQIVTNGVRIDVDAVMIEEWVGDTVWPSAYYAPITTVDGSQIVNGSITGSEIASATITGSNIANATITGTQLANATITGSNIANATISGSQIGSVTITASNIANLTITASQIANATITGAKIAGATITDANIANGTITGASIANATISGSKISGGTITDANIVNGTITGASIANATISGSKISGGTITDANIVNGTITGTKINSSGSGVDTANIVSGAVTWSLTAAQNSYVSLPTGGPICTVTLPAAVSIRGTFAMVFSISCYTADTLDVPGTVWITKNGALQITYNVMLYHSTANAAHTYSVVYVDPSPGNASVAYVVNIGGNPLFWLGSGIAMELKR